MSRKSWSPQLTQTESGQQIRQKRKWQIAMRRYILEKQRSSFYAPYFALDFERFRTWIELQLTDGLSWANFSDKWQFEHIVPVAYFDFSIEEELRLCWNFTNIRVEPVDTIKSTINRLDIPAARNYYQTLHSQTGYIICKAMLEKISRIESAQPIQTEPLARFISENQDYLKAATQFTSIDFDRINRGMSFSALVFEKEFLKKHGA